MSIEHKQLKIPKTSNYTKHHNEIEINRFLLREYSPWRGLQVEPRITAYGGRRTELRRDGSRRFRRLFLFFRRARGSGARPGRERRRWGFELRWSGGRWLDSPAGREHGREKKEKREKKRKGGKMGWASQPVQPYKQPKSKNKTPRKNNTRIKITFY